MISAGRTKFSQKLALKPRNFRRVSSFCSVHRKAQRPSKRPIESPWHDMTCAALTGWSGTLAHATRVPGNATKIEEDTKAGLFVDFEGYLCGKNPSKYRAQDSWAIKVYFPDIWAHKHAQCQSRFSLVVSCCGAAWFGSKTWWISFMHSKTCQVGLLWSLSICTFRNWGVDLASNATAPPLLFWLLKLLILCKRIFFCISRLRWRKNPALGLRHECQEGGHFCKTRI